MEQIRVGDLILVDPNEPEKGFKKAPIQELAGLSIEMSLTDGLPVIKDVPDTIK